MRTPEPPPRLSALHYMAVTYDGGQGGYVVDVRGLDLDGDAVEWERRILFLQGVEEIVRELRIKSASTL